MRKSIFLTLASIFGTGALMLGSCGSDKAATSADDSADNSAVEEAVAPAPKSIGQVLEETRANYAADAVDSVWHTTESGLKYMIVKEGKGAQPKATDNVTVHYTGWLPSGEVFDSSIERGEPTTFPLNGVIPGWTEGVQLLKEGGKAVYFIPSRLAYGPTGTPGGPIGPDQDLFFEVELIKVEK